LGRRETGQNLRVWDILVLATSIAPLLHSRRHVETLAYMETVGDLPSEKEKDNPSTSTETTVVKKMCAM